MRLAALRASLWAFWPPKERLPARPGTGLVRIVIQDPYTGKVLAWFMTSATATPEEIVLMAKTEMAKA